jgi:hypothetical protein
VRLLADAFAISGSALVGIIRHVNCLLPCFVPQARAVPRRIVGCSPAH